MKIHHTAIGTTDFDTSLRFWCDGLGFVLQMDDRFEGDWPTLFHAPEPSLHSVFLGDPSDTESGIVELVEFSGGMGDPLPTSARPAVGFFLVSVFVDVEATLQRLADFDLGGEPRRIELPGPVLMAVVEDPNGVAVELIDIDPGGQRAPD